jgi:hypothetical protein
MAQLVALLEERGLIEVYVDDEGREAYRLTEEGVRVGHMLALVQGEDAEAVREALLGDLTPEGQGAIMLGEGLVESRSPCAEAGAPLHPLARPRGPHPPRRPDSATVLAERRPSGSDDEPRLRCRGPATRVATTIADRYEVIVLDDGSEVRLRRRA